MEGELSHVERLERWAVALESCGEVTLNPFHQVEFLANETRAPLRQTKSPLDIAYRDPVLRRAGLESDRFGDGQKFFGLSRGQVHHILCSCGYIGAMRAGEVARRIRVVIRREARRGTLLNPLAAFGRRWLSGWRPLPDGVTRPA